MCCFISSILKASHNLHQHHNCQQRETVHVLSADTGDVEWHSKICLPSLLNTVFIFIFPCYPCHQQSRTLIYSSSNKKEHLLREPRGLMHQQRKKRLKHHVAAVFHNFPSKTGHRNVAYLMTRIFLCPGELMLSTTDSSQLTSMAQDKQIHKAKVMGKKPEHQKNGIPEVSKLFALIVLTVFFFPLCGC